MNEGMRRIYSFAGDCKNAYFHSACAPWEVSSGEGNAVSRYVDGSVAEALRLLDGTAGDMGNIGFGGQDRTIITGDDEYAWFVG